LVSPRVSVITPVWNADATLGETVASVQAQSVGDWEMLLVDDGSTDGSRALAEALAAADPRLRVLGWSQNHGPAAARNAAIRAAQGRYIAFLDADDRWRPEKLARQLAVMEGEGEALVFSSYQRIDEEGRPLGQVSAAERITYAAALYGNPIGCLTAIYDSERVGKMEMPPVRRRQDYGLWLRILRRLPAARGLPEVLADYRVRRGSLSSNKLVGARATWAVYRDLEGMGRARAGYYFLHYAARGVFARARA
jgi:teichuronic acid biosynthesis glycosyltransferase TuaG